MITMTLRALSVWNFPSRKAVTSAMGMEAAKPSEAMDPPDTPACACAAARSMPSASMRSSSTPCT